MIFPDILGIIIITDELHHFSEGQVYHQPVIVDYLQQTQTSETIDDDDDGDDDEDDVGDDDDVEDEDGDEDDDDDDA